MSDRNRQMKDIFVATWWALVFILFLIVLSVINQRTGMFSPIGEALSERFLTQEDVHD